MLFLVLFAVVGHAEPIVSSSDEVVSVEWHAPFFSGGGYCSEATTFVVALDDYARVSVVQHGDSFSASYVAGQAGTASFEKLEKMAARRQRRRSDVVVCHSEPGAWHVAGGPSWRSSRCPPANANLVVGRTMFETDRLPEAWELRFAGVDEVWVPTEFHKKLYTAKASNLYVIGEPVDTEAFRPEGDILEINAKFLVLSVFKWENRKGWDVLLRAWKQAFQKEDEVLLVLVTNAYHSDSDFQERLERFSSLSLKCSVADLAPLKIVSGLSQAELQALYRRADVLVAPSRGEGWGRPHVEAMASGTPVIATNWSGPTAFLTEKNGYPLAIHRDLVPVGGDGPFRNHLWADPDHSHLADLMTRARNHPEERIAKGKQARTDMVTRFSPTVLAKQVNDRLAFLLNNQRTTAAEKQQQGRKTTEKVRISADNNNINDDL